MTFDGHRILLGCSSLRKGNMQSSVRVYWPVCLEFRPREPGEAVSPRKEGLKYCFQHWDPFILSTAGRIRSERLKTRVLVDPGQWNPNQ